MASEPRTVKGPSCFDCGNYGMVRDRSGRLSFCACVDDDEPQTAPHPKTEDLRPNVPPRMMA